MAKRFFYVSAALLMLALTYHVGAQSATAQVSGNPIVGIMSGGLACGGNGAVAANGDYYWTSDITHWRHTGNVFGAGGQVPGNPIVGVAEFNGCSEVVAAANGDCFYTRDHGATWNRAGNVFDAPTPAATITWGKVKADYRK